MKRYDTMGFESEHGVYVRWADADAELAEWKRMRNEAMNVALANRKTIEHFAAVIRERDALAAELAAWKDKHSAQHCRAVTAEVQAKAFKADFKNFHRLLCERFGYRHDEVAWRRDQLSLVEFIAAKVDDYDGQLNQAADELAVACASAEVDRDNALAGVRTLEARVQELEATIDWALTWHVSLVELEEGKLGWGHAPSNAICDTLNERRQKILGDYAAQGKQPPQSQTEGFHDGT